MEVFKDIKGYEGLYQVSNLGNVKSLNYNGTGKERILKSCVHKSGYLVVILYKDGKAKIHYVHRLVAEAFIDNPDNLPCVNHKNEDKTDNRVENLEFCSYQYNINYGTRNERISKIVVQYTLDGVFVEEYPSVSEAKRQLGYSQGNISECCLGKRKTAYGYKWKYKEPQSN